MKFRLLTIYNIASIEQAEIDFDREPLASADVFLISGVTGAGKSTILDTICLALFNAVPRLGTGRSADRFNGISSRDYKQLLRTGAKEGYAELSFHIFAIVVASERFVQRQQQSRICGAVACVANR